jgi:putative transposase
VGVAVEKERSPYRWRSLTPEQRGEVLEYRQRHRLPWHSPPHYAGDSGEYLLTAACYRHHPIIRATAERMAGFESELLDVLQLGAHQTFAWVVLPNHYHALVQAPDIRGLLKAVGQLHGRTSFRWNAEEDPRGRQVWCRSAETAIKSEGHFWATMNDVLNHAVRHRYVKRWQDWPYSSADHYLTEVGREEAERRWREYPVLSYGEDWDPPEL